MKKLYRSNHNRVLLGVCGGIGEYFNVDPTFVRLLLVLSALMNFGVSTLATILVYLAAWFIIPEKGGISERSEKDEPEKQEKQAQKQKRAKK